MGYSWARALQTAERPSDTDASFRWPARTDAVGTVSEIAMRMKICLPYDSRAFEPALLAPDIVGAVLAA